MSGPYLGNHLQREIALRLIHEARSLGVTQISFSGGEPTSSPIFLEVLNAVISDHMAADVYTSGVVRNGNESTPLGSNLIESVLALSPLKFIFSVHGSKADLHDYVADSPGSFISLIDSLRRCINAGIICEINFVPLRVNASCFREIVRLATSFGIRKVNVLRFVPQGRGLKNRSELELTAEEEAAFVRELLCIRAETDIEIRTGSPFNEIIPGNNILCRAGRGKLVVQATGSVLPCEVFKHHERCHWGLSVYERSLTGILRSPQLISLWSALDKNGRLNCPIHSTLKSREHLEAYRDLSKPSVHAR